ncbi:MAG: hypothetical protein VW518_03300, partial [Burkholderiaceae bacterium]
MVGIDYTTVTESITVSATSGGASSNVVYTCPPFHDAEITFLHVSNGAASTDNISIQWYHADNTTYHTIVNAKQVAGNDVYNLITSDRLYLHAGDKITVF